MRATAIIPVKRFGTAKQRLLEALDRPQRAALARAMLADVLAAALGAELVERVIVVTGERRAERVALRHGPATGTPLEVLRDPKDLGHPEAATLGIVRAKALGAGCAALLPGDCPLLDPDERRRGLACVRGVGQDEHPVGPRGGFRCVVGGHDRDRVESRHTADRAEHVGEHRLCEGLPRARAERPGQALFRGAEAFYWKNRKRSHSARREPSACRGGR